MESVGSVQVSLLDLVVEHPFVDLDPGQTCLTDGLLLHVLGQLAVVLLKDANKNRDL